MFESGGMYPVFLRRTGIPIYIVRNGVRGDCDDASRRINGRSNIIGRKIVYKMVSCTRVLGKYRIIRHNFVDL